MNTFKVGNRVKCIDDGGNSDIKNGECYTVTGVAPNFSTPLISTDGRDPTISGYFADRFVLAVATFKVGDVVRCVNAGGGGGVLGSDWLKQGYLYTVEGINGFDNVQLVGGPGGFYPERFELVVAPEVSHTDDTAKIAELRTQLERAVLLQKSSEDRVCELIADRDGWKKSFVNACEVFATALAKEPQ